MTPQERAAQIWCKPYMSSKEMDVQLAELIAAEIQAAADDAIMAEQLRQEDVEIEKINAAYKRGQDDIRKACSAHQHNQYADGYRRGVEEEREACAKVCDGECSRRHPGFCEACKAAYIIRARTTEGGGE